MAEINFVILGIIILFFILLAIKGILGKNKLNNFCIICASISLTWIILLVLYLSGLFDNILIISLLMGMSVTGVYYLVESKIGKMNKLKIFRLPFILALIIAAYYILTLEKIFNSILIVAGLWLFFFLVYFYNHSKFTKRLLECCKE